MSNSKIQELFDKLHFLLFLEDFMRAPPFESYYGRPVADSIGFEAVTRKTALTL